MFATAARAATGSHRASAASPPSTARRRLWAQGSWADCAPASSRDAARDTGTRGDARRQAQQQPGVSAQPSSREQPRRTRAATEGVVMAAAPSPAATFSSARTAPAGGREAQAGVRRGHAGVHRNPRGAAPTRAGSRAAAQLSRTSEAARECCALPVSSQPAAGWGGGGAGGRGSAGESSKLRTDARTFPPRMPKQKLPNSAWKS